MQKYFQNVLFFIEEPVHGLRIAMVKPLQLESDLRGIQDELVNEQHALLPDIQDSGKWKSIRRGIQNNKMVIPGLQRDGALKVVFKHLACSKVRMHSQAGPLAEMCLMLITMLSLPSLISVQRSRAT